MITIDGSFGEGGGQILRSSLALSLITAQPFRIENIRARRDTPGLARQHLTAVNAATAIDQARVEGTAVGSMMLSFFPGAVTPGEYSFAIGSAGSTTLERFSSGRVGIAAFADEVERVRRGNAGYRPSDRLEQ